MFATLFQRVFKMTYPEYLLHAQGLLPQACPSDDSEVAAWGSLTPHQHVVEGIIVSLGTILIYYMTSTPNPAAFKAYEEKQKTIATSLCSKITSSFLFVATFCSLALMIYHKVIQGKPAFLLQPCHVAMVFLMILISLPRGQGTSFFNFYLIWLYGPFLGTVAADLSCYTLAWELENWLIEHLLLLVMPLMFIYEERYLLITGFRHLMHGYSVSLFYHFCILDIFGVNTGRNVNFMYCPPAPVLGLLGPKGAEWYRVFMIFASALVILLIRYVYIGGFLWLIGKADGTGTSEWLSQGPLEEATADLKTSDMKKRGKSEPDVSASAVSMLTMTAMETGESDSRKRSNKGRGASKKID